MARLTIESGTHGVETTASEMRRRLARILARIPGDQIVWFSFTAHLEDYRPAPTPRDIIYGELARPEND